jgi:hypothetical protein
MSDLMTGQIQVMLQTIPAVMPHIQSGKVRPLATSGRVRSSALPNLPTLDAYVKSVSVSTRPLLFSLLPFNIIRAEDAGGSENLLTVLNQRLKNICLSPTVSTCQRSCPSVLPNSASRFLLTTTATGDRAR